MPSPTLRSVTLPVLLTVLGLALTACGSSASTSAADTLRTSATSGLNRSYTATYALTRAGSASGTGAEGTVTVYRTPTSLRLDVATSTGVSSSITTPTSTVACQRPTGNRKPTCLTVAGAGATPPAAFDPTLREVFGAMLRVFAASGHALQVGTPAPSATPTASSPAAVGTTHCFTVGGTPPPPVATGTYCLSSGGVPTFLSFPSGTATLTAYTPGPPAAARFVPDVAPTPLPSSKA